MYKIEVFDLNLKKIAILENAKDIEEEQKINSIYSLVFSLPYDDPKLKYCQPFYYVRYGDNMYRILPSNEEITYTPTVSFECEHVIATLIDDLMYGDIVIGNLGVFTQDVIKFVLDKQTIKRWVLGICEFSRQFEYGWSHESLLSALFSIPSNFAEPYIWEYDTSSFPWVVSLKKLNVDAIPELYIRQNKNMLRLSKKSDPSNLCTRLYAHGYGEGINTLTFSDINDGKPYIESPPEIMQKYGLKTRLWVDRRYEDKESLLQAAKAMLNELQEPYYEYEVDFVEIDESFYNKAQLGKITKIVTDKEEIKTYIVGTKYSYNMDGVDCTLSIANKPEDIAASIADLADRQRIEMTYAQGATQIYAQSLQNNASNTDGLKLDFFIPEQMRIINKVFCKVRMEAFRGFVKTSSSNGDVDQTLSVSASSQTVSTHSRSTTVNIPSQSTSTTVDIGSISVDLNDESTNPAYWTSGFVFNRPIQEAEGHRHDIKSHYHGLDFSIEVPSRSIGIDIPGSSSSVTIPGQSFSITIPGHSHRIDIPPHTHEMTPGIYRFTSSQRFDLYINDIKKESFDSTSAEIDITQYLVDESGKIPRGNWQTVEVRPNNLAYVSIALSVQGFVQSRGDATV